MGLIMSAVYGLVVGGLARIVYPGEQNMGLWRTMFLGLGGGFVAGLLGRLVGWYPSGQGAGIVASVLGAMLIIWLFRKKDSTTTM